VGCSFGLKIFHERLVKQYIVNSAVLFGAASVADQSDTKSII